MRLTRTISRDDKINFQTVQAITVLIIKVATTRHEEKLRKHPGMQQNSDLTKKSSKKDHFKIVYGNPSETQEKKLIEELIERNLLDIREELKQLIKPRFKTGPRNQNRYHLVFEVPRLVRDKLEMRVPSTMSGGPLCSGN